MSIALQWGYYEEAGKPSPTRGFIYFDAVAVLKKTLTGQVSKQPIDGGGLITDHFTRENPVVTFSGIISGVDISAKNRNIVDANSNKPTNVKPAPEAVQINQSSTPLFNLLPDGLGQFFKPSSPSIVMESQSFETLKSIQSNLESLFEDAQVQLVTMYEYYQNTLKREPLTNLVMTSLTFTDTPETGEALQCDITLEQIKFGKVRKSKIDKGVQAALVSQDLANKAAPTQTGGKEDSTPKPGVPPKLQSSGAALLDKGTNIVTGLGG